MGKLARGSDGLLCNGTIDPTLRNIDSAAVERQYPCAKRTAVLVEHVDAITMRCGGDGQNVRSRPPAFGYSFGNRIRCCIPEFIHVAFDMTGARKGLRHATARNGKGGSVNIEQYGFGDGQSAVDSEQRGHVSYS